jgi:hypothetical protein
MTEGITDWSDLALRAYPPSQLPDSPAGRLEFIEHLMNYPACDEDGNYTGETVALISKEMALRLMDGAAP